MTPAKRKHNGYCEAHIPAFVHPYDIASALVCVHADDWRQEFGNHRRGHHQRRSGWERAFDMVLLARSH